MKRAQVATEYLMIGAFVLLFLISGFYFLYSHTQSSVKEYEVAQIQKFGTILVHNAAEIFYVPGSKVTVEVMLPRNIVNITTTPGGEELVVTLRAGDGYSEIAIVSTVNITSHFKSFTPGLKEVSVESREEGYVLLCNIEYGCNCNSICEPGESPETCAPDCCKSDCNGCVVTGPPYKTYSGCTPDGINEACDGHNNCQFMP